jgi:hypothetical protein
LTAGNEETTQPESGSEARLEDFLNRQQGVILAQAEQLGEANVTYGLLLIGIEVAIDEGHHIEKLSRIKDLLTEYRNGILRASQGPTRAPKNRKELTRLRDEAEAHIERLRAEGFDLRACWEESQLAQVQRATISHKSGTRIKKKQDPEDKLSTD